MMTEKQPVIKELPRAAWHGELWTSLLETQKEKRQEHEKACRLEAATQREIAKFRCQISTSSKLSSSSVAQQKQISPALVKAVTVKSAVRDVPYAFGASAEAAGNISKSDHPLSANNDDDMSATSSTTISALTMKDYSRKK